MLKNIEQQEKNMNKVYKLVWNSTLNAWVAVSELAKGKKKSSKNLLKAGVLVGSMVFAVNAQAAPGEGAYSIKEGAGSASAGESSVALGNASNAAGNASIALGNHTIAEKQHSIAIGGNASSTGGESIALGGGSAATAESSISMGSNSLASGGLSVAIGGAASSSAEFSTAIGTQTVASIYAATAVGSKASATGEYGSAFGSLANAIGSNSLAAGLQATALGNNSVALGRQSAAEGGSSVALGDSSKAKTTVATALGAYSNASGVYSTAVGANSIALAMNDTALGAQSQASGGTSVAVGSAAKATALRALAVGPSANASGIRSVAVGSTAKSIGEASTALGSAANAAGVAATAIGKGAVAEKDNGIAQGNGAVAKEVNSLAMGTAANATGLAAMAIGNNAVAEKENGIAQGNGAIAKEVNSLAMGTAANAAGPHAVSIGQNSQATMGNATAVGSFAKAVGQSSLGLGHNANAAGTQSVAVGWLSHATTENAIAVGAKANALGDRSMAVGSSAQADGKYSIAIGRLANAASEKAIAIGSDAKATLVNSVAIGENAKTLEAIATKTALTNNDVIATAAVVSFGNDTFQRRIQNVADGADLQDAVTVSQLKASQNNIANILGTSTTVNPQTGLIEATDIGGISGANTFEDAIRELADNSVKYDVLTLASGEPGDVVEERITFGGAKNDDTKAWATKDDATSRIETNGGTLLDHIATAGDYTDVLNANHAVNAGDLNNAVLDVINKGLVVAANSGTNAPIELGDTIAVKGDDTNTEFDESDLGKNIFTKVEADGTIRVGLANNIELASTGSLKVGNTTLNNEGLSIVGGPQVVASGINAGNKKITGVANGTEPNDAVNFSQLDAVKTVADKNTTDIAQNTTDIAKNATNIADVKTATDKNTTDIAQNTTNIADNKAAIDSVGSQLTELTESSVKYATDANGNVNKDSIVLDGANGTQITNLASAGDYTVAANANNAVNAGDLNTAVTNVTNDLTNKGLSFKGDTGTTNAKLGTTVEVKGADKNISTSVTGSTISIALAKDIEVDTVKAKEVTANTVTANTVTAKDITADNATLKNVTSDKVTVGDVVIDKASGINAGNKAITNIAAGTGANDAINVSQLISALGGTATYDATTGAYTGPTYEVGGNTYNNVAGAVDALNQADQTLNSKIDQVSNNLEQAFYTTNKKIDSVEKKANAGIAAAMALESAPYIAGKYTYAVGAAYHGGENAVGVTLRKTADNGRWSITGGIAAASQGDPSVRIGISGVID